MDDKQQKRQIFRQTLLQHLAENTLEGDDIRTLIGSAHVPDLFDDYQVNELLEAIEPDPLDWNADYFAHQRRLAKDNFSTQRILHLVDVRDFLIHSGIAGFARTSAKAPLQGEPEMSNNTMNPDYTPGESLVASLKTQTTGLLRSALINELEDNRLADTDISQAVSWTLARAPDLFVAYEEHSMAGKIINYPAQWDADYYYLQTSYLNANFAQSRFEHLIEVRNALRKRGIKGFERITIAKQQPQPQPQSQAYSTADSRTLPPRTPAPVPQPGFLRVALMAGGALAILAALVISLL